MKNLVTVLLAVTMGLASCSSNTDYRNKVYQNVIVSNGDRYLKTMVTYQGNVMSMEVDKISSIPTDSVLAITTARYNEANELLDGLTKLNTKKQ